MKYLYTLPLIMFIFSCKKIELKDLKGKSSDATSIESLINSQTAFLTTDTVENYIYLKFKQTQVPPIVSASLRETSVSIGASFLDLSSELTSVGTLSVNDNPIYPAADNSYNYSSIHDVAAGDEETTYPSFLSLYSQTVAVKIDGNSLFDGFTENVQVPAQINLSANLPYSSSYIQGSDLALNWATDASNQFGQVLIVCYYYDGLSQAINSTAPQNVNTLNFWVADNGTYTISASQLNAFPVNGYLGFTIYRWNQYELDMTNSSKKVYIATVAEGASIPILISERPSTYVRLERTNDYYYSDPYVTIESTNFVVRCYMQADCGRSTAVNESLTINYSNYRHYYDDYSYNYDNTTQNSLTIPAGASEDPYSIGYTELFTNYSGSYSTSEFWLTNGLYYNIVN